MVIVRWVGKYRERDGGGEARDKVHRAAHSVARSENGHQTAHMAMHNDQNPLNDAKAALTQQEKRGMNYEMAVRTFLQQHVCVCACCDHKKGVLSLAKRAPNGLCYGFGKGLRVEDGRVLYGLVFCCYRWP